MRVPRVSILLSLAATTAFAAAAIRTLPLAGIGHEAATAVARDNCRSTKGCISAVVRTEVKPDRDGRFDRVVYELDGTQDRWQVNSMRAGTHGRVPRDGVQLFDVVFLVDGRPLVHEPLPTPSSPKTNGGRK